MPSYQYPRPAVTVDVILITEDDEPKILLIQRARDPFANCWAFPGGFVDEDEDPDHAAERELKEETGIEGVNLKRFSFYGRPGRDPRGHTISLVYTASVDAAELQPIAADDARAVAWFSLSNLPELAFDHYGILEDLSNFSARKQ